MKKRAQQEKAPSKVHMPAFNVVYLDDQGRVISKQESAKRMAALEELVRLSNTPKGKVKRGKKTPPLAAKLTLHWLMSKKQRDPIIGDLDEEYKEALALFGKKAADALYWKQALQSLLPLLWQIIVRTVRLYDVLRTIK